MKKYIAKPNTWFKEGTEAKIVDDCLWPEINSGLFEGTIILDIDKIHSGQSDNLGEETTDQEVCSLNEFYIIEE